MLSYDEHEKKITAGPGLQNTVHDLKKPKTYFVGTQKNLLNLNVLLSTKTYYIYINFTLNSLLN